MVRPALALLLLTLVSALAQEGPRLEVLRTDSTRLSTVALGERRDGSFLSVEYDSRVFGYRLSVLRPNGKRRLLQRVALGTAHYNPFGQLFADENGAMLGASMDSRGTGMLSIDERGVPTLRTAAPAGFGSITSQLVVGSDGAFYGINEVGFNGGYNGPRHLYRWTPEEGFVALHEFADDIPASGGVFRPGNYYVSGLLAGRVGGLFALKRQQIELTPGSRTVSAVSRLAMSYTGTVQEGPRVVDAYASGLGELPDGRLVTAMNTRVGGVWHRAFGAFDAQGNYSELASLDSFSPEYGCALLAVLPVSGASIVATTSHYGAAMQLLAISPSGQITPLPAEGVSRGFMDIRPLVLAHDGNYYGFGYRTDNQGSYDRVCWLRLVDSQPVLKNLPPIARHDDVEVPAAAARAGQVQMTLRPLRNDSDGDRDPLTIESAEVAAPATAAVAAGGREITLTIPAGATPMATVTYRITDGRGGTATATIDARLPERSGRFGGLLYVGTESAGSPTGYLDVQVSRLGVVTGAFFVEGYRYVVRGQFDAEGQLDLNVPVQYLGAFTLHLERDGDVIRGTGSLYNNQETTLIAARARSAPPGVAGRYTAVFHSGMAYTANGAPDGLGWAVVNVSQTGRVSVAGRLGDGSSLSVGSRLDAAARFPIYAGPRRVTETNSIGKLYGVAALRPGPQRHGDATLRWIQGDNANFERPESFQCNLAMLISRFVPPMKPEPVVPGLDAGGRNAILTLGGGFLPGTMAEIVTIGDGTLSSNAGTTGTISRLDGRVFIRMRNHATGNFVTLRGVVFQAAGTVEGTFMTLRSIYRSGGYFTLVPR